MKVLVFPALLAIAIVASPPKPFITKTAAQPPVAKVEKPATRLAESTVLCPSEKPQPLTARR
ncbi:hypothetical protein [Hymenobacter sp. 102]|uniref:hypothetical protein n=1 Tax=Hymenobacter sp. 102 TaxID=3403152 RepID=UPI003CF425F1